METFVRKHRLMAKNIREDHIYGGYPKGNSFQGPRGGIANRVPQPPAQTRNLSLDQKRQLGLYFRCGEKYGQGHQCKKLLLNMEGLEEEEEDEAGTERNEDIPEGNEGGDISMHAL